MNAIKIISRTIEKCCISFKIQINSKHLVINFTLHAVERAKLWKLKEKEIVNALISPDETVIGHGNRFIAHKVKNSKIIRVIYEYRDKVIFIITVYAPSKKRYFQGGITHADKIFP